MLLLTPLHLTMLSSSHFVLAILIVGNIISNRGMVDAGHFHHKRFARNHNNTEVITLLPRMYTVDPFNHAVKPVWLRRAIPDQDNVSIKRVIPVHIIYVLIFKVHHLPDKTFVK